DDDDDDEDRSYCSSDQISKQKDESEKDEEENEDEEMASSRYVKRRKSVGEFDSHSKDPTEHGDERRSEKRRDRREMIGDNEDESELIEGDDDSDHASVINNGVGSGKEEEEEAGDGGSSDDDEEETEEDESQRITSDDEGSERCARELQFMGEAGPSRISRSESSGDEEGWSDGSEWKEEVVAEDPDCKYLRTRRTFNISKKDIPPKKWRDWWNIASFPTPFWTEEEERSVIKSLERGQSVCEIIRELQTYWRTTGAMNKYRECYQAFAYLKSRRLMRIKNEYDDEPELSNGDRLQIQRAWRKYRANTIMKNDHSLSPCFHSGRCDEQSNPPCECFQLDMPCTKFCGCDVRCRIKFPGCMCAPGKCRGRQCPCYYASWECDPDTCKSCGCEESDPAKQCQNRGLSLGKRKRVFASRSEIAGYGAFIGEDCKKGDLIEEYVGEIISVEESERRGHMYDKLRLSYTFTLNEDEVVDATRAGNVARFINHSKFPNCVARVFVVKGDHRIGIFARRDLSLGEELFFNYGYKKEHVEKFTNKEREGCDITLLDTTAKNVRDDDEEEEEEE
ncbi:hypothetical protein PENTCL1PPCAC_6198, partial [Pristionchus entomophagus]